jgi:hypothetical protein
MADAPAGLRRALSPIYELDVVLEAMARPPRSPDLTVCLDLFGRDFAEVPARAGGGLGIANRVAFTAASPSTRFRGDRRADVGLAPTRRSDFTDFSLSTKAFEYAAMGRPSSPPACHGRADLRRRRRDL